MHWWLHATLRSCRCLSAKIVCLCCGGMRCVVVSLEHVLAELVRLFVLPAWVSETEKAVDRGLSRFPVRGGEPQRPSRHLALILVKPFSGHM